MLFGVTYKVFEADTIEFVGSTHYSDEELKKYIFGGDYVNLLYFRILDKKTPKYHLSRNMMLRRTGRTGFM